MVVELGVTCPSPGLTTSQVMPTAIGHISTLPSQLVCVVREVRSNAYAALPFFLTKLVSDLPLALLGSLIFTVLLNYMTGMADYSLEVARAARPASPRHRGASTRSLLVGL